MEKNKAEEPEVHDVVQAAIKQVESMFPVMPAKDKKLFDEFHDFSYPVFPQGIVKWDDEKKINVVEVAGHKIKIVEDPSLGPNEFRIVHGKADS